MAGYRKFRIIRKIAESELVVSVYLAPEDGGALVPFRPGQYLTFRLHIPGRDISLHRNYSFSDAYNESYYRVSVKKELPPRDRPDLPAGLCSSYIVDHLQAGDILEAKGPLGDFYLDPSGMDPVVFFAGGIGITPLLSMVKSIAIRNAERVLYFIYGLNGKKDHAFQEELEGLRKDHPAFRFMIYYLNIDPGDVKGLDFDYEGFIDMEMLKKEARDLHINHYICGPAPMMTFIQNALSGLGVPANMIHTESFSASQEVTSIAVEEYPEEKTTSLVSDDRLYVEFSLSGKKIVWDDRYTSILTFAEANDIEISSGCLFGDCGTCLTKIFSGKVRYQHPTLVKPSEGTCLPCSCVPLESIVLDA